MKKISISLLIISFLFLNHAMSSEANWVPPPDHQDPILPPASSIEIGDRAAIEKLKPQTLAADVSARQIGTSTGDFLGVVKIPPFLLSEPANPIVNADGSVLGVGLPPEMARIQLTIGGEQYELLFFDQKNDPKYGLRHVTMKVVNHEDSYARFSVDDRNGLIYGTIRTPERTLRIVPGQLAGQQEVYASSTESINADSFAFMARVNPQAQRITWRHRELEKVALIQPQYAEAGYETRSAYIDGGNLGRLRRLDVRELIRAATDLAQITQFEGSESFQIAEIMPTTGGGKRIRFQQLIGGIPVAVYSEVNVDASLRILNLSTVLAPRDFVPIHPLLSQADAWSE